MEYSDWLKQSQSLNKEIWEQIQNLKKSADKLSLIIDDAPVEVDDKTFEDIALEYERFQGLYDQASRQFTEYLGSFALV